MPWTPKSFKAKHNKKLTAAQSRQASRIANDVLKRTGDEGLAIREANGVVKRSGKKKKF